MNNLKKRTAFIIGQKVFKNGASGVCQMSVLQNIIFLTLLLLFVFLRTNKNLHIFKKIP
jgi:hypothetical protein